MQTGFFWFSTGTGKCGNNTRHSAKCWGCPDKLLDYHLHKDSLFLELVYTKRDYTA